MKIRKRILFKYVIFCVLSVSVYYGYKMNDFYDITWFIPGNISARTTEMFGSLTMKHVSYSNTSHQGVINKVTNLDNSSIYVEICDSETRIRVLIEKCNKLRSQHKITKHNPGLLIQPEFRVAYCEIPKIGSTNMKRVFATSTKQGRNFGGNLNINWHRVSLLHRLGLKHHRALNFSLAENLTMFYVVRHPLDRLISAYNSKLGPNAPGKGYGAISRSIIKRRKSTINISPNGTLNYSGNSNITYQNNVTSGVIRTRVTFAEFVRAFVRGDVTRWDRHWRRFAQFCNPCRVHYDYLFRLESMTYDAQPIMKLLNVTDKHMEQQNYDKNKKIRHKDPSISQQGKHYALLKRYKEFEGIPKSDIAFLKQYFAPEMWLYGYTFNEQTLMPGCDYEKYGCC